MGKINRYFHFEKVVSNDFDALKNDVGNGSALHRLRCNQKDDKICKNDKI